MTLYTEDSLRIAIEELTGFTYPAETLKRRLKLLTPKEKKTIAKLYDELCDKCSELEEIIATRAEITQDRWP